MDCMMTIITRRENELTLRKAIEDIGVYDITMTQVEGCGIEEGVMKYMEHGKEMVMLIPKVKFSVAVAKEKVEQIIQSTMDICRTGIMGDGKIFVEKSYIGSIDKDGSFTYNCKEAEEMEDSMVQMNKVTIITRGEKFAELRKRLLAIGVSGMTLTKVDGCGVQHGLTKIIEGVTNKVYLNSKIKVDIVVCSVPVEEVIKVAEDVLNTGSIGDGKIFVSPISQVVRVRTGERNDKAL